MNQVWLNIRIIYYYMKILFFEIWPLVSRFDVQHQNFMFCHQKRPFWRFVSKVPHPSGNSYYSLGTMHTSNLWYVEVTLCHYSCTKSSSHFAMHWPKLEHFNIFTFQIGWTHKYQFYLSLTITWITLHSTLLSEHG